MKKHWITLLAVVTFFIISVPTAGATVEKTVSVCLYYLDTALPAANLANEVGSGYQWGYYDDDRNFYALGAIDQTAITMTAENGEIVVRTTSSGTYLCSYSGEGTFGILPNGQGEKAVTWFKNNQYYGGFAYLIYNGNVEVINMVDLEDYVLGVLPYEMGASSPLAALEAQAVCARTYVVRGTTHSRADVCAGTCCQVYNGLGSGDGEVASRIAQAVENTAGVCAYYQGQLIEALYTASNGGASASAVDVWGGNVAYLQGKIDPYDGLNASSSYTYSETYTAEVLTDMLHIKNYDIGTVAQVYISETTAVGNVSAVTFVDTTGKSVTVTGDDCRTIFYSSIYNKSVKSARYTINGAGGGSYYVNGSGTTLSAITGVSVLSATGSATTLPSSSVQVQTAYGVETLSAQTTATTSDGTFTVTGTGSGHQVGLSQQGAINMANLGFTYEEILKFYYTGITVE